MPFAQREFTNKTKNQTNPNTTMASKTLFQSFVGRLVPQSDTRNEAGGPPQPTSIVDGAIGPATAGLKRALERKGSGVRLLALNAPETSELWREQPRPE